MTETAATPDAPPPRFALPGAGRSIATVVVLAFFIWSLGGAEMSVTDFVDGLPHMARKFKEMSPPDVSRIKPVGRALLTTFQMALVGTGFGVAIGFLLAVGATRSQTPHVTVYYLTRGIISLARSVPDLVWAIFFVSSVGLGAFAGTLTIVVDTIGFCGRFFAEAMEEVDPGPQEALSSLGARRLGIIVCAVLPAAMPSFVNSSLFALEKAVRSSVVLGLVGAGGIGIELKVAMDMFQYQEAATIMLCIFALVVVVEQISTRIRKRFM